MTYLVDANVLSEGTKPNPSATVVEWLRANERELAVDPIILGEVRFGIHLLAAGKRRRRLERWFEQGVATLVCLSWDAVTGLRWAELLADLRLLAGHVRQGQHDRCDALVHRLTVATRNQKDFRKAGVKAIDPLHSCVSIPTGRRNSSAAYHGIASNSGTDAHGQLTKVTSCFSAHFPCNRHRRGDSRVRRIGRRPGLIAKILPSSS